MRALVAAILAATMMAMAGCLSVPNAADDARALTQPETEPLLASGDARATGNDALAWSARPGGRGGTTRVPLEVSIPEGYWETRTGGLEVSIAWNRSQTGGFALTVLNDQGTLVATGKSSWFASVAFLPEARSGLYSIHVRATGFLGSVRGVVQVEAEPKDPGPLRDLLPNLVTLTPSDLRIEAPDLYGALGNNPLTPGCGYDETAEALARRCLRLSNAVGNAGDGPLEVHLSLAEGAKGLGGQGYWVQRIYRSDGSFHDERVGPAVFHATHSHWHYSGLAHFKVYLYDWDSRERGSEFNVGRKNGFCFFDIGLVKLGMLGTRPPKYSGEACLVPASQEWRMGLSPNWFDFYEWGLPDQYVDITGAPDGVYELVSRADGPGTLKESDKWDNEASVVFRLTGNQVEVLWPPPEQTTLP